MKIYQSGTRRNVWTGTQIGFAVLLLITSASASRAQSNTSPFPSSGNVGIGTTSPTAPLSILGSSSDPSLTADTAVANVKSSSTVELSFGGQAGAPYSFWMQTKRSPNDGHSYPLIFNPLGGNIGIGTTSPNSLLQLNGADNQLVFSNSGNRGLEIGTDGTTSTILSYDRGGTPGTYKTLNFNASAHLFSISGSEKMRIDAGGNVGIGTPSPGYRLDVNGTISGTNVIAKYQDVAEWVPSSEQLSAGTVVVLDSTKSNQVTSSSVSYDTRVAGVVSEQPGIALGEKSESKVLVATTGRVRVKVDASKDPIHIGDLLVTSDIPGVAMKSEPVNLGGVQIHRPGTLIGKALEPLEKGKGEILVLLSLQ